MNWVIAMLLHATTINMIEGYQMPEVVSSESAASGVEDADQAANQAVSRFIKSGYSIIDHEVKKRVDGNKMYIDVNYINRQIRGSNYNDKCCISLTYVFVNGKYNRIDRSR